MHHIMRIVSLKGLILLIFSTIVLASKLPFETIESVFRTVGHEQLFDGVVDAVHQTTISAQTGDRIIEVLYDVDDFVKKTQSSCGYAIKSSVPGMSARRPT